MPVLASEIGPWPSVEFVARQHSRDRVVEVDRWGESGECKAIDPGRSSLSRATDLRLLSCGSSNIEPGAGARAPEVRQQRQGCEARITELVPYSIHGRFSTKTSRSVRWVCEAWSHRDVQTLSGGD